MPLGFEPSCSIQNFYVPALNKFINSTIGISNTDTLLFFDLELRNAMDNKGVHYDAVNLTFSYGTNTSMAIGTYSVPGFYQGKGKKAQRRDVAMVTGSVPWVEAAMRALSSGSTPDFRVGLVTKVKFNNYLWYSKKKRIVVGGMVEVDDSGRKVEKKHVKLRSGAPPLRVGLLVVASLLVSLFLLK
ncbi:hypothetical protein Pfo_016437 [Paulownia fortunei]|nr:hypothetical protein Pfo_016437 [Paulownia fortunei]